MLAKLTYLIVGLTLLMAFQNCSKFATPAVGEADLQSLSLATTSSPPADLVLVNFQGDCSALRVRLFSPSANEFYGYRESQPCQNSDYALPKNIYSGAVARALSGKIELTILSQSVSEIQLQVVDHVGDCRVMHYEVNDPYVGNHLSYIVGSPYASGSLTYSIGSSNSPGRLDAPSPCTSIGQSVTANTPVGLIKNYLSANLDPLLATTVASPSLTQCATWVDSNTYVSTLQNLTYDKAKWNVVCFKPGLYNATALRIRSAEHLILFSPTPHAAKISISSPLRINYDPSSPLDFYNSSNVIIDGIDFENTNVFSQQPQDATFYYEAARTLPIAYTHGMTISNSAISSLSKQAMPIAYSDAIRLQNVSISASYFPLDMAGSTVLGDTLSLKQNLAGDEHSLLWLNNENAVLKNVTATLASGRSLGSGVADASVNVLFMKNFASTPTIDSWLQQHPNYSGLALVLQGTYPTPAADYWYNMYLGGGPSVGDSITRQ